MKHVVITKSVPELLNPTIYCIVSHTHTIAELHYFFILQMSAECLEREGMAIAELPEPC